MLKKFRQDYPRFKYLFQFQEFNEVQKSCYPKIFNFAQNMIVSAPTSSGKTVLFQLLIAKLMNEEKTKCLYLAPIKSLCHEKANSWRKKFASTMHLMQLTGDTLEMEPGQFYNADIYVATPEKIDYISRKNLGFLKQMNLLLIDQIHMLNMEGRGAILQAIVSRIKSINKKIRIMAVSATIPNIKQVAQWLNVPDHLICVFGQDYRPAKLHKVVLGFTPANNDFNFQKMLNFKVLEVIRSYSHGKGTLIFCQTQKGTQQACNKIISQANQREFIQNQSQARDLINSAKKIDNAALKSLIPQGVAFHNASLSMKDRSIVQGLFQGLKVKVLCTTSTLAMGINLPARLVIIKSTKCYKGSGKGYQQYTQIELDQMMGRAGRIPYDKEGTVVIMTQKGNYNKYVGQNKLQTLQSQLYNQFIDHLNTQISLKSIQSLSQAIQYFRNSFCYIRMMNSPKLYNISSKSQVQDFVKETCIKSIKKLFQYEIIQYVESNEKIFPKQCSQNVSKNAIQVETIIGDIQAISHVTTQRDFIELLCKANQLAKYRSKLDERKYLKELNEKNRYTLKQAIANSQKKYFVLIQAQLTGLHIDSWQLRKQSAESLFFFKRLSYCIKCLASQRKHLGKTFWLYLFGCLFHKYFMYGFWESNQEKTLKQINKVASKWKNISARGIRNLSELTHGLNKLDIFGNNISSVSIKKDIQNQINLLSGSLQTSLKKSDQPINLNEQDNQNRSRLLNETNHMLRFLFTGIFNEKFKSIHVMVQLNNSIYHSGFINKQNPQFSVFLKNTSSHKYFVAVIKEGFIGFDEFYWCEFGNLRKTEMKREEYNKKMTKSGSADLLQQNKKTLKLQNTQQTYQKQRKNHSLQSSTNQISKGRKKKTNQKQMPKQIKFISQSKNDQDKNLFKDDNQDEQNFISYNKDKLRQRQNQEQEADSTLRIKKKQKQLKLTQNFSTIKRKFIFDEESQKKQQELNPLGKSLKKMTGGQENQYRDLKSYNWKPGFEQIKNYQPKNSYVKEKPFITKQKEFKNIQKKSHFNLNENHFKEQQFQFQDSQTKPIQRKLLLINQSSDSQKTVGQINQREPSRDIKLELNNNMNQRVKNPILNKISTTKVSQNWNRNKKTFYHQHETNKSQASLMNVCPSSSFKNGLRTQGLSNPPSNHQQFRYKSSIQEKDLVRPMIGPMIKNEQNCMQSRKGAEYQSSAFLYPNSVQNSTLNRSKSRFPTKILFKDNSKESLTEKNPLMGTQRQNQPQILRNEQKKPFKNPYQYFQSFLDDYQDDL